MGFGATTRSRLILFAGLYFAQGIPWGFVTVALAFRLTGLGLGPSQIGEIISVALIPWTFKFLVGPFVDLASFGRWGRRRPLILAAELLSVVTLLALATVDPRQAFVPFLVLVFANNVFVALQDVATDALAIALLPESERGRANGFMQGGKWAGSAIGGAGLAYLADHLGWPLAYAAAAALLLLPAALVLTTAEPPAPTGRPLRLALTALGQNFWLAISRRATWFAAALALVSNGSESLLAPMMVPLLQRTLALPPGKAKGLVLLAGLSAVGGSLLGGALADRMGRRVAVLIGAVALAATHLTFALVTPRWETLLVYQFAVGISAGVLYAASIALFMDLTHPGVAATHFQIFMALSNARMMWTAWSGGRLAESTSTSTMFLLGGLLELLPLALLLAIDPRKVARVHSSPE